MTKAEQAFAWWLKKEEQDGRIERWYFERMTLTLTTGRGRGGRPMKYTPDFLVVVLGGGLRMVEIKGPYIREDSVIKFKMATELFPFFEWQMIQIRKDGTAKVLRHVPADGYRELFAPDGTAFEIDPGGVQGTGDD